MIARDPWVILCPKTWHWCPKSIAIVALKTIACLENPLCFPTWPTLSTEHRISIVHHCAPSRKQHTWSEACAFGGQWRIQARRLQCSQGYADGAAVFSDSLRHWCMPYKWTNLHKTARSLNCLGWAEEPTAQTWYRFYNAVYTLNLWWYIVEIENIPSLCSSCTKGL